MKDAATGDIAEVHCTYDPATRGGNSPDGRKVKSTIHWVSAAHALAAEIRLYDKLFTAENPNDVAEGSDFTITSIRTRWRRSSGQAEPSLANAQPGDRFQFERLGYFCVDPDSTPGNLVFNRTVELRDTWAKVQKQG